MAEGGDKQLMLFDEMKISELAEGVGRPLTLNYNVFVKEHNVTTKIKGSNIQSLVVGQENKGSNGGASASWTTEEQRFNRAMIGAEDPADVTWLTPKVVIFNKRPVSRQPNSKVYHGRQEIGSGFYRDVAVKLIQYSDKNLTEIRTLLKLNHPSIVQVYEAGEHRGVVHWIYIVMELCSTNLEEYIKANSVHTEKAFTFFKQIVAAMDFMHKHNIAHRDLKPSNILISQCGNFAKVSDFGISKEIPFGVTSATTTSHGAGSEGYKPPEVYDPNYKVSLSSDIFSLGLVTAHLLSHGKHPFGDDPFDRSYKIRKNQKFDLSQIPSGMPKRQQLVDMIKRMLKHAPGERPTAHELLNDVVFSEISPDGMNDKADEGEKNNENIRKTTIVLFDNKSKHLHRVILNNKSMTKMQTYPDDGVNFFAFSLDQYIYILQWICLPGESRPSVYRLKYSDVTATWEIMSDWPGGHGRVLPSVVASSDAIFLVGGGWNSSKSVSKYNPSSDRWESLEDKLTATYDSALLCANEFLYCFGGRTESGKTTGRVERMDLEKMKWSRIADMNRQESLPRSAAECEGKIYVFSNDEDWQRLATESWDPQVNQWTEIKMSDSDRIISRMCESDRWGLRRALVIDKNLYLVGNSGILEYDVVKDELSIVTSYTDMDIGDAVLVKKLT